MRKIRYITLILFIFLILNSLYSKESIAYVDSDRLILINFKGQKIKEIKLPIKIQKKHEINLCRGVTVDYSLFGKNFSLKKDIICFVGIDNKIHWYNWKKKREKKIPNGPYYFTEKKCGNKEIIEWIDFSEDKELIVLSVRPECETNEECEKSTPFPDYSTVVILHLKTGKKEIIDDEEGLGTYKPLISNDNIIYQEGDKFIIYKPFCRTKREIIIDEKKSHLKKSFAELLDYVKIIKQRILFINWVGFTRIVSYNLDTDKYKIIANMKKKIIGSFSFRDISSDCKYILLVKNVSDLNMGDEYSSMISIIDIQKVKRTEVKKVKEGVEWAQFYEEDN